MAEASSANDLRYLSGAASAAKRSTPNVSSGWVIMLLSGLLAAALFFYATQQSGQQYSVAVLNSDVAPGQAITASSVHAAKVSIDRSQLDRLVQFDQRKNYDGWVVTAPLQAGDIVTKSMLRQPAASDGRRAMSIAVEQSHAVAGALHSGDRVDLIDASATASYVVQDIEVLAVNNSGGGALSGAEQFSITVAVDADQAVKVAQTVKNGKFDIVRSTGAQRS